MLKTLNLSLSIFNNDAKALFEGLKISTLTKLVA